MNSEQIVAWLEREIVKAERAIDGAPDTIPVDVLDRERYRIGVLDEVRQAVERLADVGEAMGIAACPDCWGAEDNDDTDDGYFELPPRGWGL